MKITKTQIYYFLLVICLLVQNRFFHIVNPSMLMTVVLILVIIVLYVIALWDRYHFSCKWLYRYIISVLIIIIVPQSIYVYCLGETLEGYIDVMRGMMNILLAVPVCKIFFRKAGMKEILDLITVFTTISLGLLLVNSISLNITGIQLLPFEYFEMPSTGRFGRLRLFLISDFSALVCIYSFSAFLKNKQRPFFYLISFAICLGTSIYVEQARMQYMAIIASCIMAYAVGIKGKKRIYFYLVSGMFIIGGLFGDWFSKFLGSFSIQAQGVGISTLIRINEYKYALKLILNHPIMGTGMMAKYLFSVSINGFRFDYNHTDIGLIGSITYIGFLGTYVLFIGPTIRMIKTLCNCPKNQKASFEYMFLNGIVTHIAITSITILITDNARIFAWPFILAIAEYIRYKWLFNDKKEIGYE